MNGFLIMFTSNPYMGLLDEKSVPKVGLEALHLSLESFAKYMVLGIS